MGGHQSTKSVKVYTLEIYPLCSSPFHGKAHGAGTFYYTPTTTIQLYGDAGDFASTAVSAQGMLCSYYVKILLLATRQCCVCLISQFLTKAEQ